MEINKDKVRTSIWLMLPVSSLIVMGISAYNEVDPMGIIAVPILILTYGAFIWIPSMIMTVTLESIFIRERSTKITVMILFGVETFLTFIILLLLFQPYMDFVPLLSLGMSIVIQFSRWFYLKYKNRLYNKVREPKIITQ